MWLEEEDAQKIGDRENAQIFCAVKNAFKKVLKNYNRIEAYLRKKDEQKH